MKIKLLALLFVISTLYSCNQNSNSQSAYKYNYETVDKESPSRLLMNNPNNTISKRPLDVFDINNIVSNIRKDKKIHFLFLIRDPRDILVSRHAGIKDDFFVHADWVYRVYSNGKRKKAKTKTKS